MNHQIVPIGDDEFHVKFNLHSLDGERSQIDWRLPSMQGRFLYGLEFWVTGPNLVAPILQLPFSLDAGMYVRGLPPGLVSLEKPWEEWL